MSRYTERGDAEHYRDRFLTGKRRQTHEREDQALRIALGRIGHVKTIVDVGCGPGRFVPAFAEYADQIIQLDYATQMLNVSRDDHLLPCTQGRYVQADARYLPLADNSADVSFCHRVINHLPLPADRELVLANLRRMTSRYVIISCLTPPRFIRFVRKLYKGIRGRKSVDGDVEPSELLSQAHKVGLRLESTVPIRHGLVAGSFFVLAKE